MTVQAAIQAKLGEVEPQYRKQLAFTIQEVLAGNTAALTKYKHWPVDVKTFVEDPYYLNAKGILYPVVMENLIEINEGEYDEVVLTGGIGAAKSTIALYTQSYQVYLLSCMASPQGYFGLDPASEIVIVFQSLNEKLAKEVDYDRFKSMIENSPYFKEQFPFSKFVDSQLEFPNRIIVKPVSGLETAAIGQNVIGGLIDEVNFMAVVENSKMAEGNVYDQATALYNSIARRRKSRFMSRGRMPGRLCLVSSRRTPGQFTDRKEEEAKINPRIFIYDKRVWEVKPAGTFGVERFPVFIGDGSRQPRLLGPDEEVADEDRHLVDQIPVEFKPEFVDDLPKAIRDIAGRSTMAIHPYLPRREDVLANFGRRPNIFVAPTVCFPRDQLQIRSKLTKVDPREPRWAHIDLGLASDSAGLVIGHVRNFVEMDRKGHKEILPVIDIDGALEVTPPKGTGGEIDFASIRRILYKLRDLGMYIKWVTLDSFQSADTMQIMRQQGFVTGYTSVDKTMIPYDLTKQALYDHRLLIGEHPKLQKELVSLERDFKKGKVDHPPRGCFTGNTRVALLDGTLPTFEELAQRYPTERFPVYSIGAGGIQLGWAHSPRVTRVGASLVEVVLDNYQVIECTPDHLFLTLDGEWVQAQYLTPDVSLMPLYRSRENKGGWSGYERVWCPNRRERLLTHQLVARQLLAGTGVVHHRNGNKSDNRPENLEVLGREEHAAHHTGQRHQHDKEWVAKLRAGHEHYRLQGGNEKSRANILALFAAGKLKRGRGVCSIEGCTRLQNAKGMCDVHYQRMRRVKLRAQRTATQQNHRVLSVRPLEKVADVWDLTVEETHNFALASGVFVHNSKDVADALAGVVFGLTTRREIWNNHKVSIHQAISVASIVRDQEHERGEDAKA